MKLSQILLEPLYHYLKRVRAVTIGTIRQKEEYSLLVRPQYAYGLLKAADIAKYFGKRKTTVCEFGVATGNGLYNMIDLAEKISSETGVEFRIVGFDTGEGLPEVYGYKNHPEFWAQGDYPMTNKEKLIEKIENRAELILGDIKNTVNSFINSCDPTAPIGFISVDVDIYTSAKDSLNCLLGSPEIYNPAVSIYFDDITHFFANKWCGELAAIEEFNNENEFRKIDQDRSQRHTEKKWFEKMYTCHILDHDVRNKPQSDNQIRSMYSGLPIGVFK
ncbi:hypothetical protein [Gloeothece verrucosa]|uniref:Class I SAM-dependent methyltransferase n=1 Tax=Gloeothece verrucosa (strain PCC 7822) TaxID=497965 RepID=E0U6V8_GLOV7|nr:hypothetical protein [Gloeothece verrucosa]ADN15995.1 conserved hypothetical protein [Gloeothece verrucosa PCC 7822]